MAEPGVTREDAAGGEGCGAPFYADGLRFACQQCSHCCRDFPGVVLLSRPDVERLAAWAGVTPEQFVLMYCRWVEDSHGTAHLSLRERQNYDCILWQDGGCTAYAARPVQCRTYPFWTHALSSPAAWRQEGAECPGINRGPLHPREEIEARLGEYRARQSITSGAGEP